jgi:hypothetical protein
LGDSDLGTFINDNGWFYHNGVNEGYCAWYCANPKLKTTMAAMTSGNNGASVCQELFKWVVATFHWS